MLCESAMNATKNSMGQEVLIDIMNIKMLFIIVATICCRSTVVSEVEVVSNSGVSDPVPLSACFRCRQTIM